MSSVNVELGNILFVLIWLYTINIYFKSVRHNVTGEFGGVNMALLSESTNDPFWEIELCLGKIFYMEEVCTIFQNTSKFEFLDILLWSKRVIRCLQYLKIYHNLSENIFKDKQQLKNVDENVSLHCPRVLSNHLSLNVCVYFEYLHIKRNRYKCGTANRRRHMRYILHI